VGISVVNALSERLEATVRRNGQVTSSFRGRWV
jgi:DNA gyrase/topoisomerase IV subunit B